MWLILELIVSEIKLLKFVWCIYFFLDFYCLFYLFYYLIYYIDRLNK